jgi:hypothetical protein
VRAFLKNPLLVHFPAYILDLVDPVTCYGNFFLLSFSYCFKTILLAKKNFQFHAQVQKCHFGRIEKLPKWHFWTRAWNLRKILAQSILLKHYEYGNNKNFHNMFQGPPNPGFMKEKVQKRNFLKKPSRELKNHFCFRFLWIPRTPERVN